MYDAVEKRGGQEILFMTEARKESKNTNVYLNNPSKMKKTKTSASSALGGSNSLANKNGLFGTTMSLA